MRYLQVNFIGFVKFDAHSSVRHARYEMLECSFKITKLLHFTHKVQRTSIFVAKLTKDSVKVQRTDTFHKLYFGALHLMKHCLGNPTNILRLCRLRNISKSIISILPRNTEGGITQILIYLYASKLSCKKFKTKHNYKKQAIAFIFNHF